MLLSSNKCCQSARDELKSPFGSCTESESLIPVLSLPSMLGFYWEFKCLLLHRNSLVLALNPATLQCSHPLSWKTELVLFMFDDTRAVCSCAGCMDCCKLQ